MPWRLLILPCVLMAFCLLAHAVEIDLTAMRQADISDILAAMNTGIRPQPNAEDPVVSMKKAEDALVALGDAYLPDMRAVMATLRVRLVQIQAASPTQVTDDEYDLQRRIEVLDNAIIRLSWHMDPRAIISAYVTGLKFDDGRQFTPQQQPAHVMDDALARLTPKFLFYTVYYPPYRGGAAPSDMILRQYEVPAPLNRANIFAVDPAGKLTLITSPDALKAFFQANMPAATDAQGVKDLTYGWLRLTQFFNQLGIFRFTIPPDTLEAARVNGSWQGKGVAKVIATPFLDGQITAVLFFDAQGRLDRVEETIELQNNMPLPC